MTLFSYHCLSSSNSSIFSTQSKTLICSINPISSSSFFRRKLSISATIIPARDRIIDFGKHRGRMLGTLPSKYLKWVSKTLRARDYEEWAKLADEVLEDPVYKDRVEWEIAEILLNGDIGNGFSGRNYQSSPVSDLLEISERFGWDNEDKIGWSRIDFSLLGTSKGGRIPRKGNSSSSSSSSMVIPQMEKIGSFKEDSRVFRERKLGFLSNNKESSRVFSQNQEMGSSNYEDSRINSSELGNLNKMGSFNDERKLGLFRKRTPRVCVEAEEVVEGRVGGSREERREKQRLKRGLQLHRVKLEFCSNNKKQIDYQPNHNDRQIDQDKNPTVEKPPSPFPGRETLLKKVLNKERIL